ncbi:S41 family peptidase [Novosphingobium cyanobacteriorum]|uniref:S41 family peptidase n=1 Tax=Novosphingobium cyanobacteriorum TaxID=3024215 RepID=A0ABT6CFF6_9SPHN|nr:S41 family peptidase [Novosphingobium cyanobacteriorum]MDF8332269.1 S41 family peptidase [Novosphingobium cyanobacteriorum]
MTARLAPALLAALFASLPLHAMADALAAPPAPATPAQPVARAVAAELADALGSDFVYPDVGAHYAAMLRANAAAGAYDALAGTALAERLTADLQAVQADGHVRVRSVAETPAAGPSATPAPVKVPNLEAGRWIAPGLAFVRFNLMASEDADAANARAFALGHLGANVLIVDLRTNNGGGLAEMDALFPFLFDKPTPLVRMATRKSVHDRDGGPLHGIASLRTVPGDPAFVTQEHWITPDPETGLRKTKVYVLTSGRTASAAEHFSLAMKISGRATLVGETTAGANHFGYGLELPGQLVAFVPVGRTYDPATGKDWEGNGVAPDIAVPAMDALVTVLEREGIAPAQAQKLSDEVAPAKSMERRKTAV